MTYHGSPRDSIANHVERQQDVERLRRAKILKTLKRRRGPAAKAAREAWKDEARRLGFEIQPKKSFPPAVSISIAIAHQKASRDKVTLAGPDFRMKKGKDPRLVAEERAVERIKKAVELLCFSINELSETDGLSVGRHKGRPLGCSVSSLVSYTRLLANAVRMPIPEFSGLRKEGASPATKKCQNCGIVFTALGPYCDECAENNKNTSLHERSEQRRSRDAAAKMVIKDVKRIAAIIRKTERKLKT